MNKHIELVKKWLADKDSVSQQELNDNRAAAADDAVNAAYYAKYAKYAVDASYDAVNAAYDAAEYVDKYEGLVNE